MPRVGCSHVPPFYVQKSGANLLQGLISHFGQLSPEFDTNRVCIEISATWEGLQACRKLEKNGITTMATAVFGMEQAALAGDAGCHYIAPWLNEMRMHHETESVQPPRLPHSRT